MRLTGKLKVLRVAIGPTTCGFKLYVYLSGTHNLGSMMGL